jgi:uncharacterized protein
VFMAQDGKNNSYYRWQGESLLLDLYIQPRASKDAIIGEYGDRLKIALMAPPVDGKANKYLIKFLANHFNVSQKQVKITRGESGRRKTVAILGPKDNIMIFNKI